MTYLPISGAMWGRNVMLTAGVSTIARMPDADTFDQHVRAWQEWAESPWGRIRFAVVRHTLTRTLDGSGPLRILDVGGGDGRDAVPLASLGHEVTVLDTSAALLALARERAADAGVADSVRTVAGSIDDVQSLAGGYDLVLCHFLLHYRPDTAADVRRLRRAVRPGGLLSLIAPNPFSYVTATLVRDGPGAALAALDAERAHSVTFDSEVRMIGDAEARTALASAGCVVVAQYGGRCANDLLADNEPKYDPAYYADLERLELALCDREPFNRLGAFWQLVARSS